MYEGGSFRNLIFCNSYTQQFTGSELRTLCVSYIRIRLLIYLCFFMRILMLFDAYRLALCCAYSPYVFSCVSPMYSAASKGDTLKVIPKRKVIPKKSFQPISDNLRRCCTDDALPSKQRRGSRQNLIKIYNFTSGSSYATNLSPSQKLGAS
jgi:hypothetical protein